MPRCGLRLALVLVATAVPLAMGQTPPTVEESLVAAVARAEPSIVAIARVRRDQPGEALGVEIRPDPFNRRAVVPAAPGPTDPDFVPNEYGAGVIVGRAGLILTAYHLLGADSDYYVTAADRRVYRARIQGADPRSDLAVLAIDATDLTPITLGDAGALRKGQIVVALGNPHAIARDGQASASWGIVSNLARKAPPLSDESETSGRRTLHQFGTLIQTDARLNQGASGGALLNLQGEMVGLTVALAATPGFEQAAGFAIPIDATFRRVIETLKQGREVEYGFLGVRPGSLKPEDILAGKQGVRVQNVVPGAPAERYGLRIDDVIVSVNDKPVYGGDGLMLEVGRLPVEANARFHVLRGKRPMDVKVVLAKYPVVGRKIVTQPAPSWRGMRVDYLTSMPDLPGVGLMRGGSPLDGVVITEVAEGQPAWKAGLRGGMVVSHVDDKPVRTPREFHAAVSGKRGAVRLRQIGLGSDAADATRAVAPE